MRRFFMGVIAVATLAGCSFDSSSSDDGIEAEM